MTELFFNHKHAMTLCFQHMYRNNIQLYWQCSLCTETIQLNNILYTYRNYIQLNNTLFYICIETICSYNETVSSIYWYYIFSICTEWCQEYKEDVISKSELQQEIDEYMAEYDKKVQKVQFLISKAWNWNSC